MCRPAPSSRVHSGATHFVWSTCYSRCVYLALCYTDVVIKDYYFEVLPRLRVPRFSLLCAPWQRPDQTVSVVLHHLVLFVRFFKCLFVPVFLSLAVSESTRREPSCSPFAGVYAAVRGSLIPRFAGVNAAVRGSAIPPFAEFTPPFAALSSRGSRELMPPFAAQRSRRSREFTPSFAAQRSRRSREFTPPFAALSSRGSRELMPPFAGVHAAVRGSAIPPFAGVHAAVRGSAIPPFADQPAHSSQEMTPPSTANPSPPARRWLNARRPASDSMPAGLPLTQCPPACRWLKLAGLPLTPARWSSLTGKANSLHQFTPPSAAHRPRRSREITPPSVGKANPPSAAASSVVGKANPPSAVSPRPAAGWGSLQPAGPCRCVVKPAGCCRYLSSQPVMVSPAGRCRIWPDCDQGLFNCFCVFSPGGLLIPLSFPKEIFWGGAVGLRPKRLRWGLGPRSRRRSHHGLPSSLLHLDLCLSVPLWRPRPVYVSVVGPEGSPECPPPSLVVLFTARDVPSGRGELC